MTDDESPLAQLLGKLETEGYSPRCGKGDEWSARCPAHDDRTASLSLREGDDGRALVYCHAGCESSAVMAALGLTMRELFARDGAQCCPPPERRTRRRKAAEPRVVEDERFGVVPAPLILNVCPVCVHLFARLAWRCGRENRPQFGLASIAKDLGVQARTLRVHAEHLAGHGWIRWRATVTETGARRADELSLLSCPGLGIVNPDVRLPNRDHGTTGAARSPRHVPSVAVGGTSRAERATSRDGLGASTAPPVARSTRSVDETRRAANVPQSRSLRYEGEVSERERSADDPARVKPGDDERDEDPPPTDVDPDAQARTLELVLRHFPQAEVLDAERCSDCPEPLGHCACPGPSR